MGISAGPDIIQDDLQLLLDASDKLSYPGSGTSWYNMTSLINFNSSYYTYPSFGGGGSSPGYFTFVNNGSTQNNIYPGSISIDTYNQTQYTRIAAFYLTSLSGAWSPIIQNEIGNNSDMGLTVLSDGKLHFRQYWNTYNGGTTFGDYGVSNTGATLSTNTWYVAAMAVNRSAQTVSFYLNGALDSTVSISVIGNAVSNNIIIGGAAVDAYGGDRMFKGRISMVAHYSRLLNSVEILQNYNATKSRFGLK